MKVEEHFPTGLLASFIKAYLFIESEDGVENRVLPDTSMVIAFKYKGSISDEVKGVQNSLPDTVITGIRKSVRYINYTRHTAALLVIFKPAGAAAFFKEPLHELSGLSIPLDAFVSAQKLNETEEQLAAATDNRQRITVIEQLLLSRLHTTSPDLLIHHAIQQIQLSGGAIRIKELVSTLPVSQDPFEKRFRKLTGTSPKQFSSIVRLRKLIETYDPAMNMTEIALTAGYFDQAHFIKDFRSFTGQTPHDFFRSSVFW